MKLWNNEYIKFSQIYQVYQLMDRKLIKFPSHETEINICEMPMRVIIPQIKPIYEN